jgi:hypothetical protein
MNWPSRSTWRTAEATARAKITFVAHKNNSLALKNKIYSWHRLLEQGLRTNSALVVGASVNSGDPTFAHCREIWSAPGNEAE